MTDTTVGRGRTDISKSATRRGRSCRRSESEDADLSGQEKNTLYYGDNLGVLREYIKDESVDLIYLDPPFNSNAQYNVIFERPDGAASEAQAGAFHDTWTWTIDESGAAYDSVMRSGGRVAETLSGIMSFLGKNDVMAYLCMMTPRLIELRRTLKPSGSQIATIKDLLGGKKLSLPPAYKVETQGERRSRGSQQGEPQLSFKFPVAGGRSRGRRQDDVIYPSASLLMA